MFSHCRMEGRYTVFSDAKTPLDKQVHESLLFQDGSQCRTRDLRKLCRMRQFHTGQEQCVPALAKLGPEPTAALFSEKVFSQKLKRHHKAIKSVCLDQTVLAGIGNIYAVVVLWLSKLNPLQPAKLLTKAEVHTY